jgi:large subunit ribosomal protein L29
MNAIELRAKTVDELSEDLQSLVKEQFTHRMQHSTGQLDQTHLLKEVAKNIARVKTVLGEKSRAMITEDAK